MHVETLSHRHGTWTSPLPTWLDSPTTLVLAFGASAVLDDPRPLAELHRAFPTSNLIGCSTSGQILDVEILDDTLTVTVARFEHTRLRRAEMQVEAPTESRAAAQALARELDTRDLRGVLVLSNGLGVNGSELARGLQDVFADRIPVTGGLAGDGDRFAQTWIAAGGVPQQHCIAAVGFYGDRVSFQHGSRGGWDVFGPERRITRSRDNVLFELDRQPALQLYRSYLGDRAAGLPATALLFPLAVRMTRSSTEQLVRTILSIDDRDQSMTFAGNVPEGASAQLMCANFDRLVDGASAAARTATATITAPGLSIAISCVGRRLVLGERAEEEIEATRETLPSGSHQVGFYSYGELAPSQHGQCDLHNQTMTVTHIVEA